MTDTGTASSRDPLLTTLLDLSDALGGERLIIGDGYGLYLKQIWLRRHPEIRTLFPVSALPAARTTQDIDLILQADVVTDSQSMRKVRGALDLLGFRVVETAKFTQFLRDMEPGQVKIDLLAAPLGELAKRVKKDSRRVKPKPPVGLHASKLEEALGVDRDGIQIPLSGELSSGARGEATVTIPQAFSYLLMKLYAYRDHMDDAARELGQHHALDIYRIVGLITEREYGTVRQLSDEFASHPTLIEAIGIARSQFIAVDGIRTDSNSGAPTPF